MTNERTYHNEVITIVRQKNQPTKRRLDGILFMVLHFMPDFLPVFEEILNDPFEHPDVRSAAALALGKVGGDRALEILIEKAQAEDITVKNYSVQALGILGREEAVPSLISALSDQDNIVFASAAEALGRLGRPAVPHLIHLLQQGADDARCVAAWQLGELRYKEAIPALARVVREENNQELVALSIWALGEIGFGPEDVIEVLTWAKTHDDPAISERADRAMKKIARHIN